MNYRIGEESRQIFPAKAVIEKRIVVQFGQFFFKKLSFFGSF